jgi:hypothetical protein
MGADSTRAGYEARWLSVLARVAVLTGAGLVLGAIAPEGALAQPAKPAKGDAAKKPAAPKAADGAKARDAKPGDAKAAPQLAPSAPATKGMRPQPGSAAKAAAVAAVAVPAAPVATGARWTAATPDEMLDLAVARAKAGGEDALAAIVVASSLDERACGSTARDGLLSLAKTTSPLAQEAYWLAKRLAPEPAAPWPGADAPTPREASDPEGLVRAFAVLGPFQDTGGGLFRREGPEAPGQRWQDATARYSWGAFEVAWRPLAPALASARGVPLDLVIHPRSESCTYLASKVTFPAGAAPVIVNVAAAGAVRLLWDGADVAVSEDVHPKLGLDRLAARVDAPAGAHLISLKVCSTASSDDGRVRVRFTGADGAPIAVASSSALGDLAIAASREPAPPPEAKADADKGKGKGKAAKGAPPKATKADAKAPAPAKGKPPAPDAEEAFTAAQRAPIAPPAGVTVLATPLARALDVGDAPTTPRALAAAILRTLGGAEDSRSPRAPGLLDRVARDADAGPDVLAMAGWVSPFGANRSGWLNLARARAEATGDRSTAAFAQRRLAASHIGGHYPDWALALANEEPLRSANDPEARLLRAMAKRHGGSSGVARAMLDEVVGIQKDMGDKTPMSVWSEIADHARGQVDLAIRARRTIAGLRPEGHGFSFVHAFRPLGGEAVEAAAKESLATITSADELLQIGRELLDIGRYAAAKEVFTYATRVAPNRPSSFYGLAAARRSLSALDASKAAAGDPIASAALARARDLEPGDATMKAEASLRQHAPAAGGGAAPASDALRDEQYIVPPTVFLSRMKAHPAKVGEVFDRELHWVRAVTYHADKRVSQMMHYAREIVVQPRTEADLYERGIPMEGDENELLLARVHRKNGTVVPAEEQASGGRRVMIRWPELEPGDVVEVAVRSWTAGPVGRRGDAPFYFIDYVGAPDTHPILYNEVVVDSPTASPLAIDVLNGKAERTESHAEGDRTVSRYIWDAPPSVREEPFAPKLTEVLPVVVGSTFGSWGDFREWYRGAVAGFTTPDEQVKRLAEELTKGKKSEEEKIKALFDFVADDIRYVNYVSGEWWLPNRPQELLARRQGDCDDKAMLLITLLKSIGVEATEVLVQTRYTAEPSVLSSTKAAIPVFDHGIAYLPGKKGKPGTWLDATSPESRLGPLPSMDARAAALFVDEGPAKIVATPASQPSDHGIDVAWKVKLDATGAADITATEQHTGDSAFELRMNLKQADARAQWVEQYLANGWLPTVQVKPEIAFDGERARGAATLKYEAHTEGLGRREGGELAVPVSEAQTLTSQLAPLVKRTLPVVLPPGMAPGFRARTITIEPPPGYKLAELPPGGEENGGEFGSATLRFERAPAGKEAVLVKRTVTFDLSTVPVDKYDRWRAWLSRVDGLMHRMVRFVPDEKGPAKVADRKPAAPAPKKPKG